MRKLEEKIKAEKGTEAQVKERSVDILYQRTTHQVDRRTDNPADDTAISNVDELTKTGVNENTEMKTASQENSNTTEGQRTKIPDIKSTEMFKGKTIESDALIDTSSEYLGIGWTYS